MKIRKRGLPFLGQVWRFSSSFSLHFVQVSTAWKISQKPLGWKIPAQYYNSILTLSISSLQSPRFSLCGGILTLIVAHSLLEPQLWAPDRDMSLCSLQDIALPLDLLQSLVIIGE